MPDAGGFVRDAYRTLRTSEGEQGSGRVRRSCERPWYDGQINLKWKALRWTSADFNSAQSKLMALVTNMMWLSTAARFASAGRSPRRNSARSSDTPGIGRGGDPQCQRRIVGTGRYGSLPVMDGVKREARRREIELLTIPTNEALETLVKKP